MSCQTDELLTRLRQYIALRPPLARERQAAYEALTLLRLAIRDLEGRAKP